MYEPDGAQLIKFLLSNNQVDVIQGPIGSGKSVALMRRLGRHAMEQKPSPIDGLRKTRWFVARNTYPELKNTTIRTWKRIYPPHLYGDVKMGNPPNHVMAWGDVRMEVDFLALDDDDDIAKLMSAEYTGGAFNEVRFTDFALFREARSRVNRYPEKSEGGPTWAGIIADTNAPDEDHWLAFMTGQSEYPSEMSFEDRQAMTWPSDWGFYLQPPALVEARDHNGSVVGYEVNPDAENLRWLNDNYYADLIKANKKDWIDNRLMNRTVFVAEGSPVWPMFRPEAHVATGPLDPVANYEVLIGLDFGRTPAAVFAQEVNNRIYLQYELQAINMGAEGFAPRVKRFLEQHYPGHKFRAWGDPKGRDKGQNFDITAYDIFKANGIPVAPAPVKQNNIATRVDAVGFLLNDMSGGATGGMPRFVMSPLCRSLKVGMAGRYCLVREDSGELIPSKNRYSHLCDALQYLALGMGEGRKMGGLTPTLNIKPMSVYRGRSSMRRVTA